MGGGGGIVSTAMGNLGNPGVKNKGSRFALNLFDPGGTMGTLLASADENKGYQVYGVGEDPNIQEDANLRAAQAAAKAAELQTATENAPAMEAAKLTAKKRQLAMSKTKTTYTSPLGTADTAGISKKTLLGV